MPLTASTLAAGLDNPPRQTTPESAEDFASAYRAWFEGATGLLTGAPAIAALDAAELAMKNALVFTVVPPTGAAVLLAGISAFWVAISTGAAVLFTTAIAATPPTTLDNIPAELIALALQLDSVITNTDAMAEFAGVLHAESLGGLWNLPATATAPIE